MKLLIATHNKGKLNELSRVLEPLGIDCISASDLGKELSDPEETGSTFAENAEIKALCACKESGYPCIADDSGLVVDALEGRPGIYTARYAGGHDVPFSEKIPVLLEELKNVPDERRTARFVCSVCCAFPNGKKVTAEGKCEGKIGYEAKGEKGFGFDPVFYINDRSFAEFLPEEKDKISHRGNALKLFAEELKAFISENNIKD